MSMIIDGTAGVTFNDASVQPKSAYGPAFSAYQSTLQSVPNTTGTIVTLQTKEFDTATAFNNTNGTVTLNGLSVPAYSFMPNVAGYYHIDGALAFATNYTPTFIYINKNGVEFKRGQNPSSLATGLTVSTLVYLNGSTDYISLAIWQGSGGAVNTTATQTQTYFQGIFIRGA